MATQKLWKVMLVGKPVRAAQHGSSSTSCTAAHAEPKAHADTTAPGCCCRLLMPTVPIMMGSRFSSSHPSTESVGMVMIVLSHAHGTCRGHRYPVSTEA